MPKIVVVGVFFIYVILKYVKWLKRDSPKRMPAVVKNGIVYIQDMKMFVEIERLKC